MPSKSRSPRKPSAEPRERKASATPSSHSNPSKDRNRDTGYPKRDYDQMPPSCKLFVTNIDSKFGQGQVDKELRACFEPFGRIKDIVVKTKAGSANSYCFIQYDSLESAVKARQELKGRDFKGKELKVEFGKGERKIEDRRSDKCYICHKEGHFAKDCDFNRFNEHDDRSRRYDRDRDRKRDRSSGRDYGRDRHSRDRNRDRGDSADRDRGDRRDKRDREERRDREDREDRRYRRDRGDRERDWDRDREGDRDGDRVREKSYRDRGEYVRDRKPRRKYSSSSCSSSPYRERRDRDRNEHRRPRYHRSPEKSSKPYSSSRRYD